MAKVCFLKSLIYTLSLPHIFISFLFEITNFFNYNNKILMCLNKIDDNKTNEIPNNYINVLVAAEDHRNDLHAGIDPIAIARCLYIRLRHGVSQGGSTIEQQFVRVATNRFEKKLSRKLLEQILAISLCRRREKVQIAKAYLSNAFYGSNCVGIHGLKAHFSKNLAAVHEEEILCIIARLKYPKPLTAPESWQQKITIRTQYIQKRMFNSKLRKARLDLPLPH